MNKHNLSIEPFDVLPLSPALVADLRSDHAGEAGAVQIYRGMLAVSRDPEVRQFALAHIRTELRHLRFFDRWLPQRHHSRLLPVWRAAGWLLGAGSALFGRRAAFHTVAAVETFVERHYLEQIEVMSGVPELANLSAALQRFCNEEVYHRNDASHRVAETNGIAVRAWAHLVGLGSILGVRIARKV
ncbi:MAG: demethoxyubiquinone hydroxylase family protein [Woeseiaceae bacterium]|nr:demethoxyubiquinone hydroxylase family protein [Woeseiaceae bacterium]